MKKQINSNICKCGHHTKDHSYSLAPKCDDLECDKCNCQNFEPKIKEFIQCGYEDKCKNKECLKCPRKNKYNLSLSLAEEIVIEEFATCDLLSIASDTEKQMELMQKIMYKVMKKIFKEQKDDK